MTDLNFKRRLHFEISKYHFDSIKYVMYNTLVKLPFLQFKRYVIRIKSLKHTKVQLSSWKKK